MHDPTQIEHSALYAAEQQSRIFQQQELSKIIIPGDVDGAANTPVQTSELPFTGTWITWITT